MIDRAVFGPEEVTAFGRIVYAPVGCEVGKLLPGGIIFVSPDEEIARDLHEYFGIPLKSAEAITIAARYGGKLYLSNERACEVALALGFEVEYMVE